MPELYDPTEAPDDDRWFPGNNATALLVACIESCKDFRKLGKALSPTRPAFDKRGLTLMATPVLSLMENMVELQRMLAREDRSTWPAVDQEKFTKFGRELRKEAQGAIRKLRNVRSGHKDGKKLGPASAPQPSPEVVLLPLGPALMLLVLALNHNRAFQWTRFPDASKPDEMELFIEVATRFKTTIQDDGARHPTEILSLTVTKDPRHSAMEVIESTIALYNDLMVDAGYPGRRIKLRSREEVEGATPPE